ncbi:beta strand repeat-containing protein [Pseudoduganella sp.]|uniref:beta strand repeat-containing protein n=1 Tax=Pseudoduganella sp. TaxID=1880898 RepID=UPI0035B15BD9
MAVQADYISAVQQLYVSYFGRPADYYGLDNFTKQLAAIDTAGTLVDFKALAGAANAASPTSPLGKLINSFSSSPEAAALYGTDTSIAGTSKFVAAVYKNILGREADVEGLTYWVNAIQSGGVTRANAAAAITEGALSNTSAQGLLDAQTVANKNKVAVAFTAAIDTTNEINGYSGDAAAAAARAMLVEVNNTTNVAAFQATVESTLNGIVQGVQQGTTYNLTTGVDTINGTIANDTIKALIDTTPTPVASTLTALDTINGGAGNDTLEITAITAASIPAGITLSNVENVTIRSAAAVNADASTWTGVQNLTVTEAAGAVTLTAAAATNIKAALAANVGNTTTTINGGKDVVVTQTKVDNTADDVVVGGTTAAAGTVTVTSTGVAAAHGANVTMGDIAVTGGTTVNVTQVASESTTGLTVGAAATHTQGSVTVTGTAATTTVNVKQTAAVTARAGIADVAEVVETASVKFSAMTAGQTLTAAGVTFTAAKNLTAAEVAAAFSKFIEGTLPVDGDTQGGGLSTNGTYTGAISGWTSAAANGDTVVFTSTVGGQVTDLSFTGTATAPVVTTTQGVDEDGQAARLGVANGIVTINDAAGSIKTITVDGYATGSSVTGGAVLETLNLSNAGNGVAMTVADTAATLALNLEKVGGTANAVLTLTAAPTTLNVKSTGANRVTLSAAATETLNVSGTGVFRADTADLSSLKTVKVTGTAGVRLDTTPAATLTSVDTTGTTGASTFSVDASKATVTGGAGTDTVTLTTTTVQKAITLGAGNDKVTLASGTTSIATEGSIVGGDGTDSLQMVTADAVTASAGTAFAGKVTGFERLIVTGATGAQEVEADVLGNYNDVTVAAATGGHALTIDGLTSGATLRFGDNTNISTTAKIKNADTGTADVLNIAITATGTVDGVADSNGSVTAANVETINISTADGNPESPVNLSPDTQNLTLVATSATKIVVTGNTDLNLTNSGNVKVATIDGSAMTGALTVQAAGNTATTITGGAGDDVLTASSSGSGNVAQVSTLTFTNGTGETAMAAGDQISVTVAGSTHTVPFNTSFAQTLADLTAAIDLNANVGATLSGNVITITASAPGTSFTANTVFTSAVAAGRTDSNVVGTYADGAVQQVFDVDTIAFTDNAGAAGAMAAGDSIAFTITDAAAAVTNINVPFNTSFAQTLADAVTAITAAGYTASLSGSTITVTGAAGKGEFTIGGFVFTDANAAGAVTAVTAQGATNFVADADTLVVAETGTMGTGDTITVAVTNGAGTYTTAAIPFSTNLDTTMAAVATAVAGLNASGSFNAAYDAATNTLTVTDKVTGGSVISNIALTYGDSVTTVVSSSFTTTTSNLAVTAAADVLNGGAGNDTLIAKQGMATLTGGAGNDLFVIDTAPLNVNSYSTITDFTSADLIQFAGATSFVAAKVTLGDTAVFQDYANAAINSIGANSVAWFQFGGATYVVMDAGANSSAFDNANDMIVKLTGNVDLTNASFNSQYGTIGLI